MILIDKHTDTPILIEARVTAVRLALDKCSSVSLATHSVSNQFSPYLHKIDFFAP